MYVKTQDSRLKTQDSRLKRITIATLLAVSTLSGVAFAETDAEKIKRLESDLKEYTKIVAKYRDDLKLSHQKYQEYHHNTENKLIEQSGFIQNSLDTTQDIDSEIDEDIRKTEALKTTYKDSTKTFKNLEEENKQLHQLQKNAQEKFLHEKSSLEQDLRDKTQQLEEKQKELINNISTHSETVEELKQKVLAVIETSKQDLEKIQKKYATLSKNLDQQYLDQMERLQKRRAELDQARANKYQRLHNNISDLHRQQTGQPAQLNGHTGQTTGENQWSQQYRYLQESRLRNDIQIDRGLKSMGFQSRYGLEEF